MKKIVAELIVNAADVMAYEMFVRDDYRGACLDDPTVAVTYDTENQLLAAVAQVTAWLATMKDQPITVHDFIQSLTRLNRDQMGMGMIVW